MGTYSYKRHLIKNRANGKWDVYRYADGSEGNKYVETVSTMKKAQRYIDSTYSWEEFAKDENAAIDRMMKEG